MYIDRTMGALPMYVVHRWSPRRLVYEFRGWIPVMLPEKPSRIGFIPNPWTVFGISD